MTLSARSRLFAATILAGALVVGAYVGLHSAAAPTPTLNEALYVPQSNMTLRLMPADVDKKGVPLYPTDSIIDLSVNGVRTTSFIKNKDGTSEDQFFQADGEKLAYTKDFYRLVAGERGRRQQSLVIYAADGATIRSEEWYRFDGTIERSGHLLQDGKYQLFNMYPDGVTPESEQLTQPNPYSTGHVPKLLEERHWRSFAQGHSLVSLATLTEPGNRELREFDEQGRLTLFRHDGLWGVSGTTVQGYYPDTGKLRLDSKSDYETTNATYFRRDGTIERTVTVTSWSVVVRYFDVAGKNPTFAQTFWIRSTRDRGEADDKFALWQIEEFNSDGKTARSLTFGTDDLTQETVFGDTFGGVTYERRQLYYRKDGTLEKQELYTAGSGYRTVTYTTADNLRAVYPAIESAPFVMTDRLPVPPPQRNEH